MPTRTIVGLGKSVTLTVQTVAPASAIQWKRNGRFIPGATAASYTISDASPVRDGGWYAVEATDAGGVATSAPGFVTVAINPARVLGYGDNTSAQITIPTGLTDVVGVAAGYYYSLALKSDGTVVGWGRNDSGQTSIPAGLSNVVAISAGYHHAVALKSDGTVVAWGRNTEGETNVPAGLANVVALDAGSYHTVALKSDGTVVAWGKSFGGLTGGVGTGSSTSPNPGSGAPATTTALSGVSVPPNLSGVVAVAAGFDFSLALKANGTVTAWGDNQFGDTVVPADLRDVVAIDAGEFHAIALKADGTAVAWGYNAYGQGSVPNTLTSVAAISAGGLHNLMLKADGGVTGWGRNADFQILFPSNLSRVVALAGGGNFSLVVQDASDLGLPAITAQPQSQVVVAGGSVTFSVTATSAALVTYQWSRNGAPIGGATNSRYTIGSAQGTDSGTYSCVVTNAAGGATTIGSALKVLTARLTNLSVRTTLAAGQAMAFGFTVTDGATDLLFRAAGPALRPFNIPDAMSNPTLELWNGPVMSAQNSGWSPSLGPTFARVGAFPFATGSDDSAVLRASAIGSGTIITRGESGGVVLVECYDAGGGGSGRLTNFSARNRVGTRADIVVAGFTIAGTGTQRILIRGIGPALRRFAISDALDDAKLEIYDARGTRVAENDNWDPALVLSFTAVGAFALTSGSKDAAVVVTLPAGQSYTAQVSGVGGSVGEGLVEIYELP